jgi:dolichol-phosphate mannosyltransferase
MPGLNEMFLSVIVPAHDDEGTLRPTVDSVDRALTEAGIPHEILVVDDHSTDGTPEVLEWLGSKYPSLRSLGSSRPQGFGYAVQTGIEESRGEAVCIVPPSSSTDAQAIVAYYGKLQEGHDCAFGSRSSPPLWNRLTNSIIGLLFGMRGADVIDPFQCYRRTALDGLRPIVSRHANVSAELPLKAVVRGYSYSVVPIKSGAVKARTPGMGSRYLFSVLYVLIEKLFSRGDYRRQEPGGVVSEADGRPSMLPAWLAFAGVVAVHLLFVKTYPLNDLGGDTPGYVYMMMQRRSSLCAAPGYPFLAGLPLSIGSVSQLAFRHGHAFRSTLLFMQHAFDVLCLAVLMGVLARVYNRRTAVIAVAIAGLSLQGMGVTSSAYPEWLQGDLLILAISFALLAWRSAVFARKAFWYSMAFGAFTWAYLVKFNAALVLPVLLLVMALEKIPWKARARLLAIAAAFAFFNYAVFLGLYHRPKTGTTALSYDHSWVLMARLSEVYDGRLPHPQGIATKRWLALSAVLPPNYEYASIGPFENVNAVPAEVRRPYRAVADRILNADHKTLDEILRTHPLPAKFTLNMSSIPISWFVGLKESDELGVQVFFESVRHSPRAFAASTVRGAAMALRESTAYPIFPTKANVALFNESVIPEGGRRLRLVQQVSQAAPYRYTDSVIWAPGFAFFSAWEQIPRLHRMWVALVAIGFLAALIAGSFGGWSDRVVIPLMGTLFLAAFVVFSAAVLEFRWKEMRFALPVVAIVLGIAFGWTFPEVIRLIGQRIRLRDSSSAATEP